MGLIPKDWRLGVSLASIRTDDLPPVEGGIQFGRYAVIQTLGKNGWVTTAQRIWRDGAWHDVTPEDAVSQVSQR